MQVEQNGILCIQSANSFTNHLRKTLCSLPIKEAVRTSILSRNWRYNWTEIPKLVFDEEEMFDGDTSDHDDDWSYEKRKMVSAIRQVLFLHRGPIFEFSVSMDSFTNVELDQIIHDLARNKDTLKKLTLHFCYRNGRAFGSLTSLYFHSCNVSSKAIFHLLSNCPLLKRLKLHFEYRDRVIECCFQNYAWRELPAALVNLKCISLFGTVLFDNSHLPLLCHVLRSSPNLEKITLTAFDTEFRVIEKVIIELSFEDADRQLEILRTLLQSPRASSAAEIISPRASAEIIVTHSIKPWNDYNFSEALGVQLENL
ncbi:F-box/FBD/LRR-repeat protein-like protein [Tanacetum coccineum]